VVGLFLSTRALGLYVAAAAFMNFSRLVTQSVGLVAYPNIAGRKDPKDADRAMWKFTAIGVAAALAIFVALELTIGHLIVLLFGDAFAPAEGVARLLLVAALLMGARRVLSDAARGANRPLVGTIAEITSWAILLPAMVLFTPLLGLDGVAVALVIASAASLIVVVRGARRRPRPEPLESARAATALPEVTIQSRDVV
jgi:O-antigen/teichoic acid export membrane protein